MHEVKAQVPLRIVVQLPAHPYSIGMARNLVRGMHPLINTEQLERAELIVSEIVTNAIRYGTDGAADVIVEFILEPSMLRGKVTDSGPSFSPPTAKPQLGQVGGFGLHIVDRLASSWEIERTTKGNVVMFSV
jgi:anti-sigma regulatory factor (Ser/Thr protein kinase)